MRMRSTVLSALLVTLAAACGGGSANIRIGTMPPGGTFHGVWQSPQYGEMHMCQTGSQVVGDYVKNERQGRIQGTIQGDVLRFQWEEEREMVVGRPQITRGRGYFRIEQAENDDWYIRGEWGHDDSETGGGPWNGVKLRRRDPTRCAGSTAGSGSSSGGSGGYDDGGYDDGGYSDGGYSGGGYDTD